MARRPRESFAQFLLGIVCVFFFFFASFGWLFRNIVWFRPCRLRFNTYACTHSDTGRTGEIRIE